MESDNKRIKVITADNKALEKAKINIETRKRKESLERQKTSNKKERTPEKIYSNSFQENKFEIDYSDRINIDSLSVKSSMISESNVSEVINPTILDKDIYSTNSFNFLSTLANKKEDIKVKLIGKQ